MVDQCQSSCNGAMERWVDKCFDRLSWSYVSSKGTKLTGFALRKLGEACKYFNLCAISVSTQTSRERVVMRLSVSAILIKIQYPSADTFLC
jgi:hypothetical protein